MSKVLTEDIIPSLKAQVVTKAEFEAEIGNINSSLTELDTGAGV